MKFTDFSPSRSPLQLPVEVGVLSTDSFQIINLFYGIKLKPEDYQVSQAYQRADGLILLELTPANGNTEDSWVFGNLSKHFDETSVDQGDIEVTNPLLFLPLLFAPLKVEIPVELDFVKNIPVDVQDDIFNPNTTASKSLSMLINGYLNTNEFKVGTYNNYSTAGFILRYKGKEADAGKYNLLGNSEYVVVFELTQGENKGLVYLKS